jgi:hypothetical protein
MGGFHLSRWMVCFPRRVSSVHGLQFAHRTHGLKDCLIVKFVTEAFAQQVKSDVNVWVGFFALGWYCGKLSHSRYVSHLDSRFLLYNVHFILPYRMLFHESLSKIRLGALFLHQLEYLGKVDCKLLLMRTRCSKLNHLRLHLGSTNSILRGACNW